MSIPSLSRVRLDELVLPSGALGAPDPLPPLAEGADLHADAAGTGLDDEMLRGLAYGKAPTVLPYLLQNGYGRELVPTRHPVAVLEDERMRATFLIGLGGRLWSLIDKRSGRQLLHSNPVFRPANLALRNAWFAGGVEWNLGTTGHWPLTCSPLHAVRVRRPDGSEALRLYEYERMRRLVVRLDFSLAPDRPLLLASVTIRNPKDIGVPVYWWSNIAVPESDDVRVITPGTEAYRFGYEGTLSRVPFPDDGDRADGEGVDRSYTTRSRDAADYFFELERAPMPWIAALDGSGRGLFQASTRELRGRKLFFWGTGPGSRHWQRWLTEGEHPYLEIQAGLARTQLEHLPMPAGATWRWTEAYGLAEADAAAVHGPWDAAVAATALALERAGAGDALERESRRDTTRDEIVQTLQRASGWGALENVRRRQAGEPALSDAVTPFPGTDLGPEQEWWAAALAAESVPSPELDPAIAPLSYQADPAWVPIVSGLPGWRASLQEGVLAAADGRWDAATEAWRASIAERENGWAWRNLAVAAVRDGDHDAAAEAYARARGLLPHLLPLTVEACRQLLVADRPSDALALIDSLDAAARADGRVQFARARALLARGELTECGRMLEEGIEIPDLKEGESSLDALWIDYQAARLAAAEGIPGEIDDALRERAAREFPPPARYDFRMHTRAGGAPGSTTPASTPPTAVPPTTTTPAPTTTTPTA